VAALGSGISMSNAPGVGPAQESATKIFDIIDEKSDIDVRSGKGIKKIESGIIEFVNVDFKYPSRN
jgi:ABC-type multidrug transport system fused ATPase/permease subunit